MAVNNTLNNNDDGGFRRWSSSAVNMVLANNAVCSPGKNALNTSGSTGTFAANFLEGGTDRTLDGTWCPGINWTTVAGSMNLVNEFANCSVSAHFPSLQRRDGSGINKKPRSHRSAADGVVNHKTRFKTHSET